MSVLYFDEIGELWLDAPAWVCAQCDELLDDPVVLWQGAGGQELLHAGCAAHKGASLLKDSRQCELAGHPAAHWRARAVATVRRRLKAEEAAA